MHHPASASSASAAAAGSSNTPGMEAILRERGRLEALLGNIELEIYKVLWVFGDVRACGVMGCLC